MGEKWENVAIEGKESEFRGWRRLYDGGRVGKEVSQVFCTVKTVKTHA